MKRAQLVLTGGPSLYEAKRAAAQQRPLLSKRCGCRAFFTAHCVTLMESSLGVSSPHVTMPVVAAVDSRYGKRNPFSKKMRSVCRSQIAHPRLGFFGVIDERFDAELITAVADAAPELAVGVGRPGRKNRSGFAAPSRNVHWLGQQPYEVLPHLVAQWDVCLLPLLATNRRASSVPRKRLNTWLRKTDCQHADS